MPPVSLSPHPDVGKAGRARGSLWVMRGPPPAEAWSHRESQLGTPGLRERSYGSSVWGPDPCHSLICKHGPQFPHLSDGLTALSGLMQSLDLEHDLRRSGLCLFRKPTGACVGELRAESPKQAHPPPSHPSHFPVFMCFLPITWATMTQPRPSG